MSRRLLVILAAALLAASCSSADTLATVNGEEITKDDLYALNPAYEESISSLTGEDLREDVSGLVVLAATLQAAEEQFGVSVTEADITDRLVNPPARYASILAATDVAGDAITQRNRAAVTLMLDTVAPSLMAEELGGYEAILANSPETVARLCIRHIAVATEEEANAVLARLADGEDFVALAAELSLDTVSPEGLLIDAEGVCLNHYAALAPEFAVAAATAELNVPTGPIASGSGFSVIMVEDRVLPASAEELAASPMDYIDLNLASSYYSAWASESVRLADVEVSPELGTWSSAGFGIAPPSE